LGILEDGKRANNKKTVRIEPYTVNPLFTISYENSSKRSGGKGRGFSKKAKDFRKGEK